MDKKLEDDPAKISIIDKLNETDKSNNKYLNKKREIKIKHETNKSFNISYINKDSFFYF